MERKKLRLNLDDLTVDSFAAVPMFGANARGTVHGYQSDLDTNCAAGVCNTANPCQTGECGTNYTECWGSCGSYTAGLCTYSETCGTTCSGACITNQDTCECNTNEATCYGQATCAGGGSTCDATCASTCGYTCDSTCVGGSTGCSNTCQATCHTPTGPCDCF